MELNDANTIRWCQELLAESTDFPDLDACVAQLPGLDALADLPPGTRALVRCDTDVVELANGELEDDVRLRSLVETLTEGHRRGWVQIAYGHRGRDPQLSLAPAVRRLEKLLAEAGVPASIRLIENWMDDATGAILDEAAAAVRDAAPGAILMLENTRKYSLEQALWKAKPADLPALAPRLTRYARELREKIARVHVNEGFASSNRDLSSTVVPMAMDRVALGRYIERELRQYVTRARQSELVIFSGMKLEKLDDLQGVLRRGKVKFVLAAGLLAIALKKAAADKAGEPFEMGASAVEIDPVKNKPNKVYVPPARVAQAGEMLALAERNGVDVVLPVDFVLGDGTAARSIPPGAAQFDVGPETTALFERKVGEVIAYHQSQRAAGKGPCVAFHNGVFGKFEEPRFAVGTKNFIPQLKRLTDAGVETYVGGGEGGAALKQYGDESWVTHLFTAGGTILKALGTEPIPYLKALTMRVRRG